MTTWRYHLCLLFFLCIISSSEGNCYDYFDVDNWKENLNNEIYLVETENLKDTIECTLERECCKNIAKEPNLQFILNHCFKGRKMTTDITEKCENRTTTGPVPYYHFMCLTAKVLNMTLSICKYDTVCRLYSEEEAAACVKTPTVLSPTTSTEIPTPTPALPKSETAAGTTPSATCACSGEKSHNTDKQEQEGATDRYILTIVSILFIISVVVNLAFFYSYWKNRGGGYWSPSEGRLMTDPERPEEPRRERRETTAL